MNAIRRIYEEYETLFGTPTDTAAVRGNEEQPDQASVAAPRFP